MAYDALKLSEEIKAYDLVSKTQFYLYEYYKSEKNFNEPLNTWNYTYNLKKICIKILSIKKF